MNDTAALDSRAKRNALKRSGFERLFQARQAYGSAFELGYASAIDKPVFLGFPPGVRWRDDMWFSALAGLGSVTGHVGAVDVLWKKFCDMIGAGFRTTPSSFEEICRAAALSALAEMDWRPL